MSNITTGLQTRRFGLLSIGILAGILGGAVGMRYWMTREADHAGQSKHTDEHGHGKEEAAERGPHNGRLLSDGDFQIEVAIFERGVPPQFRVYASESGRPVNPEQVRVQIKLRRLGGLIDEFAFQPTGEYLRGDKTVEEPHSFDVEVIAEYNSSRHEWKYPSYEGRVTLTPEMMKDAGIESATAGPGKLERMLMLPGEVRLNADRVAHIVPRVSGMVREVRKNLGDAVTPGEVIAILDSRELADAKAADLAAASRYELAKANIERIQKLFEKKIAPEEELLKARQALAETDIDHRTAEAKLHALGLSQQQVESLHDEKDTDYSRYEIKAPFAGTVIEKHITLGEVVSPDTSSFVLADLSNVWIDATVYSQDIPNVVVGRSVVVSAAGADTHRGEIAYVSPKVDEGTRTGMARVVLPNADGHWRPGMFVRADLVVSEEDARIVVPDSAIQTIENQPVVFIEENGGFEQRPVVIGRRSGTHCEILSGLNPGARYAKAGTFILKAELGKSEAQHEH